MKVHLVVVTSPNLQVNNWLIENSRLDLPKLQTITFNDGYALTGNSSPSNKLFVGGERTYNNVLIMKSMFSLIIHVNV